MPFLVAPLIHKIGLYYTAIFLSSLLSFGQFLTCLGISFKSFHSALLGRFLLGMGESVVITQPSILSKFLDKSKLAQSFGFILCVCKMMRVFNDNIEPILFEHTESISLCFWFSFSVSLFAVGAAILLYKIESLTRKPSNEAENVKSNMTLQTLKTSIRLGRNFWLVLLATSGVYTAIYSFYINLSSFFQSNYRFSNIDAGHIIVSVKLL